MNVLFLSVGFPAPGTGEPRLAPFQQADVDLLRSLGHEVRVLLWWGRPLRELWRGTRWADVVFSWNIGEHSFAASFVAGHLICVIGGYDFASLPDCDYGNFRTLRGRILAKRVWRRADALLYVDPSLMDEASAAMGHPGHAFYVPTGYDSAYWTPGETPRRNCVLTVANAPWPPRVRLKGIDLFLEVARLNPDLEFQIVGEMPPFLVASTHLTNVTFHGFLESEGLRTLYRTSKVYAQLSLHEGLPNAVCEAMLCGCVPVGTRVNGIPRAVGDSGFLVDRDPSAIQDGIRRAIAADDLRSRAREHIVRTFPLDRRRRELGERLDALRTRLA